jgi:hypothetical protein
MGFRVVLQKIFRLEGRYLQGCLEGLVQWGFQGAPCRNR